LSQQKIGQAKAKKEKKEGIFHEGLGIMERISFKKWTIEIEKIDSPTGMNYALSLELLPCTRKQANQKMYIFGHFPVLNLNKRIELYYLKK